MRQTRPAEILEYVSNKLDVTCDEIISPDRRKHIAHARQIAIYLMRGLTNRSYENIGEFFNRDHSTIIHAFRKIANLIASDKEFALNVFNYSEAIRAAVSAESGS